MQEGRRVRCDCVALTVTGRELPLTDLGSPCRSRLGVGGKEGFSIEIESEHVSLSRIPQGVA